MNLLELAQVEVLGPPLADVTGDPRWSRLRSTLLTGGKSNLTFLLYSDAGSLVLRRPPTGSRLPSAHDMSRETRVQRALAGSGVPVPRVVFEDNGDLTGFPCYVMERVEGHVIRDLLPPGYADQPGDCARIGEALLRTLAALHEVDPAAVGLEKHGRPEGFFARQVARWSEQWERSKCTDVPAVAELARRLAVRPPRCSAPRFFTATSGWTTASSTARILAVSPRCWTGSCRRSVTRWQTWP